MVVIASSRSSKPSVLISSVSLWRILFLGLALIYPVSLLLLYRATTPDESSSANVRGATSDANNNVNQNNNNAVVGKSAIHTPSLDNRQGGNGKKAVIGYAVSITGCGSDPLTEGYVGKLLLSRRDDGCRTRRGSSCVVGATS